MVLERGGVDVTSEATDAVAAVAIALAERPDVAIIAAELPGGGLEATREIAAAAPRVRVVFLTGDPSGEELVDAVVAGAVGYLGRDVDADRLPDILRAVLAGEVALRAGIRSTWWTRSGGKTSGVGVSPRGPTHG